MNEPPILHPISEEIQNFITERRSRRLSANTIEYYSQELKYFRKWLEANTDCRHIENITADVVRQYMLALEDGGRNPGGVDAAWRALKAWLRWWEDEEAPENWKNPMKRVARPKINLDPRPGISLEDFGKLVATCTSKSFFDLRDKAILLTLFDSGVRRNEFISLNICDLDMQTGQVRVLKGKGNKFRVTFVGAKTRRAITRYLRKRPDTKPTDPLWVIQAGTRMSEDGLRQMLVNRSKKAGLEKVPGLHDFRRAFALQALKNGMDIFTLQKLMGHTSLNILRRYLDQKDDDLRDEFEEHGPVDGLDLD